MRDPGGDAAGMSTPEEYTEEQQTLDGVTMGEGERQYSAGLVQDEFPIAAFSDGAEWGAGWAFAIIGMAEAIADGIDAGRFSREHWEYIGDDGWERWPDGKRSKAPPEGY